MKTFFILFFLISLPLLANMTFEQANSVLAQNTLENQQAGVVISNPSGGYLALVSDLNALRDGAKIVSLVAWPPENIEGEMISADGDTGHTSIVLGQYNVQETSYGKYPAHEMQVAFIFSALSYEPVPGEIVKKPADYLERRMRSQSAHGITFLLSEGDYQKLLRNLEQAVKDDHIYDLNCDNCSSWAIDMLKTINIDFEQLVGPSDATPWVVTSFAEERFGESKILNYVADKYQGIYCANPLDITQSLENFWQQLGLESKPLPQEREELSVEELTFLQKLGKYLGVTLREISVAVSSEGSLNVTTEGSLTKNISPVFSFLDFGVDVDFRASSDPVQLNKALATALSANCDLAGLQVGGSALSIILQEGAEGVEIINEWLRVHVQVSFYLNEERKVRFMVRGSTALQSSKEYGVQVPFELQAAIEFGKLIISYTFESELQHLLRFEYELSAKDSIFLLGGVNFQSGEPKYQIKIGYRRKL